MGVSQVLTEEWAHFWMWMIGIVIFTACIIAFMWGHKHHWKGWFGGPDWPD